MLFRVLYAAAFHYFFVCVCVCVLCLLECFRIPSGRTSDTVSLWRVRDMSRKHAHARTRMVCLCMCAHATKLTLAQQLFAAISIGVFFLVVVVVAQSYFRIYFI